MEPAMSVPTPSGDPRNATSAPSPPLDPPAVKLVLWGLRVLPKTLFSESAVYFTVSIIQASCFVNSSVSSLMQPTPVQKRLSRISEQAPTYHHCLRNIRLAVEHSTEIQE